jgi:hypothetical protein
MPPLDHPIRIALTPDEQTRVRQRGAPFDGSAPARHNTQAPGRFLSSTHPFPATAALNHTEARLARGARHAPESNSKGPIDVYSMMGSNRRGRSRWGQAQAMQEAGQPRKSCSELQHATSTTGHEIWRRIATNFAIRARERNPGQRHSKAADGRFAPCWVTHTLASSCATSPSMIARVLSAPAATRPRASSTRREKRH